ncbi:hypothetical protein [Arcanobacterium buesumense]|uniref:hypothetical protein n=1 Tax=Arcanobacterium buesumense TaxID=2722751 RepID=UPI001B3ADAB2|nr:hypothetical protein [Arcanobacterium buesumense]
MNHFEALPDSQNYALIMLIMKSGMVGGVLIISIITTWMYANVSDLGCTSDSLVVSISQALRVAVQHVLVTFILLVVTWAPVVMLFIFPHHWVAIVGYMAMFGVALPGYIAVINMAK